MDAGMDKGLPNGKANWRCDRGEIHCCTHPVGIGDGRNLGGHHAEIKAADDRTDIIGAAPASNQRRFGRIRMKTGRNISIILKTLIAPTSEVVNLRCW
ncbi:hypothetical protein [Rhizobium sp. BK538]|nr:hypothetical protein [Rhizobium sp. BK538]MBB4167083.1 hypothetical protein [Rhizobium sp. BK538]